MPTAYMHIAIRTNGESRGNLIASLDHNHWRWLLELYRKTGRK